MKNQKLILFKESALINSENKFTFQQRNIINAFLYFSRRQCFLYNNKENNFFISNNELKSFVAASNITYASSAIEIIKTTWFRVNIDKKDKSGKWPDNFSLIQAYTIEKDGIRYKLSNVMFDILTAKNSKPPFAELNSDIITRLKNKYAEIIYEFITDYRNAITLPYIPIEELKLRFGIQNKYSEFNGIEKKIKKAIKKIKDVAGLQLNYIVSRSAQTPVAIKFIINKKSEITNNNDNLDENNMTTGKVNSVYLPESNKINPEPQENQELNENNMTDNNTNIFPEEPKKWEPTPEQRERARVYLAAYPDSPQNQILKERYGI